MTIPNSGEQAVHRKRYSDEAGTIEVLCTKAGPGSLVVDSQPLELKAAKLLPSSD